MKRLKIGAYIRVSTDKQVQVFEGSLDTQKYRMVEFVKNRNRENKNWGEIVEFYVEEGISAGTAKRPEYQRMMADVRSGKINLVLVHDVARLSRNTHDFEVLLKELERFNSSYLSMKEQFDTSTPAGRLMMNMVVNMAQFEREQVSERVSINCHSRATRGFRNGGSIILGYERDDEKSGTLLVNEEEAQLVRLIFDIFTEQGSVRKTILELEARGIYPKNTRIQVPKETTKIPWSYTGLQYLLSNKTYIGMKEVNKKNKNEDQEFLKPWQRYQVVKASWPAIVSEKLFELVQQVLEESLQVERRRLQDSESRVFLLSGILSCGECGSPLHGQSSHGVKKVHRYYSHSKRGHGQRCEVKRIRADDVENEVVKYLTKSLLRAGYFDKVEETLNKSISEQPKLIREEVARLKKSLMEVDKEISSVFRLQSQLDMGSEAALLASEHLEKLGNQRKGMVHQLEELALVEKGLLETHEARAFIENRVWEFKKGFPKATPAVRRRLIRKVFDRLVHEKGELKIYFHTSENATEPADHPFRVVGSDLTPSFGNLRIDLNGWGSRTRTCE